MSFYAEDEVHCRSRTVLAVVTTQTVSALRYVSPVHHSTTRQAIARLNNTLHTRIRHATAPAILRAIVVGPGISFVLIDDLVLRHEVSQS